MREALTSCVVTTMLILGWLAHVAAPPALRMEVTPRIAFAPSEVRVRIWLVPEESDRALAVVADSETGMRRRSDVTLTGRSSPRLHEIRWRDLEAGEYAVVAAVGHASETRARVVQEFTLLSRS